MKRCPACTTRYPNNKITCDIDRSPLSPPGLDLGTVVSKTYGIICTGIGGQGVFYPDYHNRLLLFRSNGPLLQHHT
jgi:hypothetical protein